MSVNVPEPFRCRSCNAHCQWVRNKKTGNLMLLDAEPVPDGNVVIEEGLATVFGGTLFEERLPVGVPRYKVHHATCPERKEWRKKK